MLMRIFTPSLYFQCVFNDFQCVISLLRALSVALILITLQILKEKLMGNYKFFLAKSAPNKLRQFSRSRLVPHCWPFPCFLGQYRNAVYANILVRRSWPMQILKGSLYVMKELYWKWLMCHKNWHTLQCHQK